jgi:riboflavin synthase
MFTGIIEETGLVARCERGYPVTRLIIKCKKTLQGSVIGDSIAVDGICLTIVEMDANTFTADVQQETSGRTIIETYTSGTHVNLERALTPTSRMGGHYVQGHVDDAGIVRVWRREGADKVLRIALRNANLMKYIVPKGFVTLNGISLTVTDSSDTFSVHVIPHTYENTTLQYLRVGQSINVEVDVLAKYVESCIKSR